MANLLDYLDWRGDLTWEASPFNEVDNLILAELSFVDFKGIVPEPGEGESVPLSQAAEAFFNRYKENGEAIDMGVLVPGAIPSMLEKMAQSKRVKSQVKGTNFRHKVYRFLPCIKHFLPQSIPAVKNPL